MKAILEFDLNEPQDERRLQEITFVNDMQIALWDTIQMFRNAIKYEGFLKKGEYLTEEESEVAEKFQSKFFEILEEHNIRKLIEELP